MVDEPTVGSPAEMRRLFITGRSRSGTTLVQTLLNSQEDVVVFNDTLQTFTFLARDWGQLCDELTDHQRRVAASMTRWDLRHRDRTGMPGPDDFRTLDELHRATLAALIRSQAVERAPAVVGHKVNSSGGIVPRLLEETEIYCLYVVRDIRDVLISHRSFWHRVPTRQAVDAWLDELDAVTPLRGHPRLYFMRYEDLVRAPREVASGLASWLGVTVDPALPLVDDWGRPWQGNSSFEDVERRFDAQAIERWREDESDVIGYAEHRGRAWLARLGYPDARPVEPSLRLRAAVDDARRLARRGVQAARSAGRDWLGRG